MEDGDIRTPKQLPFGPQRYLGPANWKTFSGTINSIVFFGPAFLFFVVLTGGNYFFSETTEIQKNVLGDFLLMIPRIDFDVDTFRTEGGNRYGEKCLFLWQLLVLCLIPCFIADIWLFNYVTKNLDHANLARSANWSDLSIKAILLILILVWFFLSRFSLYRDGNIGRGLPMNAFMFFFPSLILLMVNMLAFFLPLYAYAYRRTK